MMNLEKEVEQLASALSNRSQGSDTQNISCEGKQYCKAITLKSGKYFETPKEKPYSTE